MKQVLIFSVLFFSQLSFADSSLPTHLHCKSKATSAAVQDFHIRKIETQYPESNISDSSFFGKDIGSTLTTLEFSNECDNMYSIAFYNYDLDGLATGRIQKVQGLLTYSAADSQVDAEGNPLSETVLVTCTK